MRSNALMLHFVLCWSVYIQTTCKMLYALNFQYALYVCFLGVLYFVRFAVEF